MSTAWDDLRTKLQRVTPVIVGGEDELRFRYVPRDGRERAVRVRRARSGEAQHLRVFLELANAERSEVDRLLSRLADTVSVALVIIDGRTWLREGAPRDAISFATLHRLLGALLAEEARLRPPSQGAAVLPFAELFDA